MKYSTNQETWDQLRALGTLSQIPAITQYKIDDLVTVKKGTKWGTLLPKPDGTWAVETYTAETNLLGKVTDVKDSSMMVFVESTKQFMSVGETDVFPGHFTVGV